MDPKPCFKGHVVLEVLAAPQKYAKNVQHLQTRPEQAIVLHAVEDPVADVGGS